MDDAKKERVRKYGEVFTPKWVVDMMLDNIEKLNPEENPFSPKKTFLEPSCGDGAFVVEILRRKFANCKKRKDYTTALESVYGFEIQSDNVQACIENVNALCREYFKPTKRDLEIIKDHIIQCDALKILKMMNFVDTRYVCVCVHGSERGEENGH